MDSHLRDNSDSSVVKLVRLHSIYSGMAFEPKIQACFFSSSSVLNLRDVVSTFGSSTAAAGGATSGAGFYGGVGLGLASLVGVSYFFCSSAAVGPLSRTDSLVLWPFKYNLTSQESLSLASV